MSPRARDYVAAVREGASESVRIRLWRALTSREQQEVREAFYAKTLAKRAAAKSRLSRRDPSQLRGLSNYQLTRVARRALGLSSEHYPVDATAEGVLPDGRAVRLTKAVRGPRYGGGRRTGMGMHRIQILCSGCSRWFPIGRINQHEGTGSCYRARGRDPKKARARK